ncbi:MAG: hypothetical protein IH605_06685 [Burkholderiales bacterium]|nr:hypothetical protein [Burkholderiales bacterium]
MALTLPKLKLPTLALDKKQLPAIVGGVVVLAAAGWFGWQYFAEEAAPPPPPPVAKRPQPVTAAKPLAKAAAPADTPQARDKLVGEVLAASGLKQELDQLPERLVAGVRQSGKEQMKAPPALINAIEDAVTKSFTAEGFQSRVNAALKKDFDQNRLQALLKDFSTPAGKSMIEQERAAQSPEAFDAFARSAAAKNPERAALIKRIDAATKASELAVDVAFASMKALAMGIVGEGKGKTASVDQAIEAQRAESFDKIRNATQLNIAFSFRDASDADLQKYADIYESESSKWFYGLVHAAIVAEASGASTEAGNLIAKLDLKPMTVAARHGGPNSGADARSCLALPTNTEIAKCAEAYR